LVYGPNVTRELINCTPRKDKPMKNKYKPGTIVFEKMFPKKKLVISRYANKLYHCLADEGPKRKEFLFFEKELMMSH
jgi:hypothetical protein